MTRDELRTGFPHVHALFAGSPQSAPPKPGAIDDDLMRFLREQGFDLINNWTPPGRKAAKAAKPTRRGAHMSIRGRTIELAGRFFATHDDAQGVMLFLALDMLEQELKTPA